MADINQLCDFCKNKVETVFMDPGGTRDLATIASTVYTNEQCFVADEIRFLNGGQLVFTPEGGRENPEGEYFRDYFVICRKLTIIGGNRPGNFNPCGPDDPGRTYSNNNVITWYHRLETPPDASAPSPMTADDGTGHDRNKWTDDNNPNGNSGAHGTDGSDGGVGNKGRGGIRAPSITLIALEVEFSGITDHLTIDFNGQVGAKGGRGQNGGEGGNGMGGRNGDSDTTWPGTGCDRQPGNGGNGGDGGNGGAGGDGGRGGDGGAITVWSTNDLLNSVFLSGSFSYVNGGATGGAGGLGGVGGRAGRGGNPGFPTSQCDNANSGVDGVEGSPQGLANGPGSTANQGVSEGPGNAGPAPLFETLPEGDTCADMIPLAAEILPPGVQPAVVCRGFSSAASENVSMSGVNLAQINGVSTSLAGVTASIRATSNDTQLDLTIDMTSNSDVGQGDLIFSRIFGPDHIEANAITVQRFEVTAVAPGTGGRGETVDLTITGTCFDIAAALQNVSVSGAGVSVINPIFVDETTVTCSVEIGNLAPQNARDVTVQTGTRSHTLIGGFTVT